MQASVKKALGGLALFFHTAEPNAEPSPLQHTHQDDGPPSL